MLITLLISGIAYIWFSAWKELSELESKNQEITNARQKAHSVYVEIIKLSLLGENVLGWKEQDMNEYHEQRLHIDTMLCRFKIIYQPERIDSVCYLLEEKEIQLKSIMKVLDEQDTLNEKIAEYVPKIAQKSTQEQPQKTKRKGFLGLFGKKEKMKATMTSAMLHAFNRDMIAQQQLQNRKLSEYVEKLTIRNIELNYQLQELIQQMNAKIQDEFQRREQEINIMREQSLLTMSTLTGVVVLLLFFSYTIIHQDIRKRERNRKKLEETIRKHDMLLQMHKRMILTISHDIRGPLNIISGSTELAIETREKRKRNGYLKNVHILCNHILHLLNNLLDVYRLNESKEIANNIPFRLNELLERIASNITQMVNDKGLLFIPEFYGTDVTVKGDIDRIEQIANNLLTNAVKFTKAGNISLIAQYNDGKLLLKVCDTGIGMTKETIDRIFLPFERCADSTNVEGFGLGLSITKGLVSLLGGSIDVSSTVGKGTSFHVSLPLPLTDKVVEEDVTVGDNLLNLPGRVIVIDDDPMQLEITKEMLERNGISCTVCNNSAEVIKEIRRQKCDLLMTDIQMPNTDGFALLELLRKSNIRNSQTIPIVAMTAKGENERETLLDYGFAGCIFKPFSMTELLKHLSSIIQQNKDLYQDIDFEVLISDIADKCKVLKKLVESSKHDLSELQQALIELNHKKMRETVHRMLPLWQMLGIGKMLEQYSAFLKENDLDTSLLTRHTKEVMAEIELLIEQAEKEMKMIENEEHDTDSGR